MNGYTPRCSVLYVPAANAKAMSKAETLDANAVIFDLEDAVAPEAKVEARQSLVAFFNQNPASPKERVIRINGLSTSWGGDDLEVAIRCRPDAVLIPKVSAADDVRDIRQRLDLRGAKDVALWAMIETPLAIVNIAQIAALATEQAINLRCFVAGTNDLAKEAGLSLATGRPTMMAWLAPVVIHAKAFGIDVIDGVYNDFRDADGFAIECREAMHLGFDGKTLIHPSQIDPANAIFAPSAEAIADAQKIVAAFEKPENSGKGVITIDGKMTERLHAEMAKKLLAKASRWDCNVKRTSIEV